MAGTIDRKKLEQYVAGALTPTITRRVEAALEASAGLRAILEEVKGEAEIVETVKDSQAIRLPEDDEERIVSDVLGSLGTTLGNDS